MFLFYELSTFFMRVLVSLTGSQGHREVDKKFYGRVYACSSLYNKCRNFQTLRDTKFSGFVEYSIRVESYF